MAINLFPEDSQLNQVAVRMTCASFLLALITLPGSITKPIKIAAGLSLSLTSLYSLACLNRKQDYDLVSEVEAEARVNVAADKISAYEILETNRVKAEVNTQIKNQKARRAEFEVD